MQIFITISGFIITILLLNAFKGERDLILVISIIFIIVIGLNIIYIRLLVLIITLKEII